jgi:putative flavoprotein involved in K+ transport
MAERTRVLVIGGGQAGLSAGYYLSRAGIPFLILDAGARVGESWRRRWDSLELFTVGRYSALPGLRFPGDPERFAGKDDVAAYLESYAGAFELPVRLETPVASLGRRDSGYRAEAENGSAYEADHVIVATGAYQCRHVPELAERLDQSVAQLHSVEYKNPEQLPGGDVLVVGGANSGVQIAQELAKSRRVQLAVGTKPPRFPRRILGKSLHWWGDHLGIMRAPIGRLRQGKRSGDLLIGTSYRQLVERHGVELLERVVDGNGRTVTCADGRRSDVDVVIWATGFRSDYSWIQLPVFDEQGGPVHRRGVTKSPGFYFLGMHLQHSLGSSLIGFVRYDAKFIVDRISGNADAGQGAAARRSEP